jgi:hypothetical protein
MLHICRTLDSITTKTQGLLQSLYILSHTPKGSDWVVVVNFDSGMVSQKLISNLEKQSSMPNSYLLLHPYVIVWCTLGLNIT